MIRFRCQLRGANIQQQFKQTQGGGGMYGCLSRFTGLKGFTLKGLLVYRTWIYEFTCIGGADLKGYKEYRFTGLQVYRFTGLQVYRSTGLQVYRMRFKKRKVYHSSKILFLQHLQLLTRLTFELSKNIKLRIGLYSRVRINFEQGQNRFGVGLEQIWSRVRIDLEQGWNRFVQQGQNRFGVGLDQIWSRARIDLEQDQNRFGVGLEQIWSRVRIGLKQGQNRFKVALEQV